MFFKSKAIPLQARQAVGFRGIQGVRSCFYCGNTDENNFDVQGKLQQLKVKSIDKNLNNDKINNHIYICERCRGKT